MDGIKVLKSTQIIILGVCFAIATIRTGNDRYKQCGDNE